LLENIIWFCFIEGIYYVRKELIETYKDEKSFLYRICMNGEKTMNKYLFYNSILVIVFLAIFAWNNYSSDKTVTFPVLVVTGIVFSILSIINRKRNLPNK
jgi:hypothetical protein